MRQYPQTYLITGGNRGVGRGFVQHSLATPFTTNAPRGLGSRLLIVQMTSGDEQSVKTTVRVLQDNGDIEKLDVVIANASVVQEKLCRLVDVSPEEMESLIRVNA
ncbi:hypothetical protein BHE90_007028 [Fusarium euwallaceae]|uniref:Ketoreductase (KR) domain-containing protein n=1 Tax=Fusarium euwallaceae TaxID=1147111 RepID=A0A430LRY8_9HYPO|nr:hypothetical protein BHE90_007028 [Fusarium euwallaceae]